MTCRADIFVDQGKVSPFALANESSYQRWREAKLQNYPTTADNLIVEVRNPLSLTVNEISEIKRLCRKTNMAIYSCKQNINTGKNIPKKIGEIFALRSLDRNLLADEDAISSLRVMPGKARRGYIPYTNKRLLWHTDGYYNAPKRRIRAFLMHCVTPAASGGGNALLDHEMLYIMLRDADPNFIRALMEPDAMIIPANTETGTETRSASTGPVFFVDPVTDNLYMRYTARTHSIQWKQTPNVLAAVLFLEELLASDMTSIFHHHLEAGQGLICNNVLHNRSGFVDDTGTQQVRLIYRARYHDRVAGTGINDRIH